MAEHDPHDAEAPICEPTLASIWKVGVAESLVLIGCAFWGPLIWIRDALGGWWDLHVFDGFVYIGMVISFFVVPLALLAFASEQLFVRYTRSSVVRVVLGSALIVLVWTVPRVPGRLDWAWRQNKGSFEQIAIDMMRAEEGNVVNIGITTAERGEDYVGFRMEQVKDNVLVYAPDGDPDFHHVTGTSRDFRITYQLDANWSICYDGPGW